MLPYDHERMRAYIIDGEVRVLDLPATFILDARGSPRRAHRGARVG